MGDSAISGVTAEIFRPVRRWVSSAGSGWAALAERPEHCGRRSPPVPGERISVPRSFPDALLVLGRTGIHRTPSLNRRVTAASAEAVPRITSPKMKRKGNTADFCPLESQGAGDCRDWRRRTPSQQWGDKQNQPVLPQRRFRKFRSRRYQAHLAVQGEGCLQVRETDSSWAGQGQGPALGSAQAAERTAGSAVAWILGLLPSWPKAG